MKKALRNGDINAAMRIRSSNTALDAKRIGNTISTNSAWETEKVEVITSIFEAKLNQAEVFRDKVKIFAPKYVIVEATYDDFWGIGIDELSTLHTKPKAWHRSNKLGQIITSVAQKCSQRNRANRSLSVPRQPARKASKHTQQEITAFVMDLPNTLTTAFTRDMIANIRTITEVSLLSVTFTHEP